MWRDVRRERLEEREWDIVSRPAISRCRVCNSVVSALPRREERDLLQKDCVREGAVAASFRSRLTRRVRFSRSISFVASKPTCLRVMSLSETRGGLGPKVCQMLETLAKPERSAMRETPVMPRRSRHAVKRLVRVIRSLAGGLCGRREPMVQKPMRKRA